MLHADGMHVNRKIAQGVATRANLVAIGRELFGSDGFGGVSIEQIATAAHVTKGALYHHFVSKEDLFRAVYEQVKRDVTDEVAPSFVEPAPWDALVAGCHALVDAQLAPNVRRIALFEGRAVLGWETAREIESRYGPVLLRGALRRAMNAEVIERQPLGPLAQMLNGAINEACLVIADSGDDEQARAEVRAVLTRVLEGLRPS